jgi:SPP1 family predicted phage head-tail adaptor
MLQHKEIIGRLDYRITFQQKQVGENESNEDEEVGWENIDSNPTVWASKKESTVASGEEYRADKLTGFQNTVFVCRYRNDITVKNRIAFDGFAYDILSIQEVGRKRFLSIETETTGEEVEELVGAFDDGFSEGFEV